MQEIQVQSLGQKDPQEKGMETHSSISAWVIPWREEPGRLQSMGPKELYVTKQLSISLLIRTLTSGQIYVCIYIYIYMPTHQLTTNKKEQNILLVN